MITPTQMIDHLMTLERLNLGSVKAGQAELWAEVLNNEIPDVTPDQLHRAILRLAGSRSTEVRGVWLTPADLVDAVKNVSARDRQERAERLQAAKSEHGDFTAHPQVTEPGEFLRFKQVTQAAFLDGSTVEQAQAAGFAALGRTVPPPQLPTKREPLTPPKLKEMEPAERQTA